MTWADTLGTRQLTEVDRRWAIMRRRLATRRRMYLGSQVRWRGIRRRGGLA